MERETCPGVCVFLPRNRGLAYSIAWRPFVESLVVSCCPAGVGWDRAFYDDMNWMALALLRADAQSPNRSYVAVAEVLTGKIMSAWDESCCLPGNSGGVWCVALFTMRPTPCPVHDTVPFERSF